MNTQIAPNNAKREVTSTDHTPRAPALSCNFLDLDGIGRHRFFLQAAPDHDNS